MNIDQTEHFCTLFDSAFLPMGIALQASLQKHHPNFHLWIICMDTHVEAHIKQLGLRNVSTIPLDELETPPLLEAKKNRSRGEYCWTITPFTFQAVFARDPSLRRVTYLDADLFFFDNPGNLLDEMNLSGKNILYTEHAYAPKYDQAANNGKYCVQFLSVTNTLEAKEVIQWWQDKCIEWCYDRIEPDRFGDQKYLEQWEKLFPTQTHVLQQTDKTLAPWNVDYFFKKSKGFYYPVFYHFHGLRIVSSHSVRLHTYYFTGKHAGRLYEEYVQNLRQGLEWMHQLGIPTPYLPKIKRRIPILSMIYNVYVKRTERYHRI